MCSQLTFFFVFLSWLDKSCQFKFIYGIPKLKARFQKQHNALSVVSEDQPQSTELDEAALVPESEDAIAEDISTIGNSSFNLLGSDGKPGFISFYNRPYGKDKETPSSKSEKSQNSILWFVGPAVLVASFIFPSLYLRKVLSIIFEDSLLTGKVSMAESLSVVFVHCMCFGDALFCLHSAIFVTYCSCFWM